MKKTINFILTTVLLLSISLSLLSCGSSKIKDNYSKVENHIKSTLIDPTSLIVNSAEGVYEEGSKYIYYKINYNAKNKFGGYVGSDDLYCCLNTETDSISSALANSFEVKKDISYHSDDYHYEKIK